MDLQLHNKALIVSLIKYVGRPSTSNTTGKVNARRFICLHRYDEVIIHSDINDISEISEIMCEQIRKTVVVKRLVAFRFEADKSTNFNVNNDNNFVYIILLRVNRLLNGLPSLFIENIILEQLKKKVDGIVEWGVFRTFSKKEILFLCHSDDMNKLEEVQTILENAEIVIDNNDISVFDVIECWPCVSNSLWESIKPETENKSGKTEIYNDSNKLGGEVRGLRVVGLCHENCSFKYKCSSNLNEHISKRIKKIRIKEKETDKIDDTRPIKGLFCEREVDRPISSTNELLHDIKLLRNHCGNPYSSCAVYLCRSKSRSPIILKLDFSDESLKGNTLHKTETSLTRSENSSNPDFDKIKNTRGSKFIGMHLQDLNRMLTHAFSNPNTVSEFEDLKDFEGVFNHLCKEYTDGNNNNFRNDKEKMNWWGVLRAIAQSTANYLEYAVRERLREDACDYMHNFNFAPLSASGFSRIAPVGGYSIYKTLLFFEIKRRYLCLNGFLPSYRELGDSIPFMNSDLRATLEPFYHFGLGHEIGHVILRASTPINLKEIEIANEFKHPDRLKFFSELYADGFCFFSTFGGDIDVYLDSWIRHYLDIIDYDYQYLTFLLPEDDTFEQKALDRILQYTARLIYISMLYYYHKNKEKTGALLWRQATEKVKKIYWDVINSIPERSNNGRATIRFNSDIDRVDDAAQQFVNGYQANQEPYIKKKTFEDLESLVKYSYDQSLIKFVEKYETVKNEIELCKDSWNNGKVNIKPVSFPIAAMVGLRNGENKNQTSNFAKNVAAIVSIYTWEEYDRLTTI